VVGVELLVGLLKVLVVSSESWWMKGEGKRNAINS
jgi:hypothetical protein